MTFKGKNKSLAKPLAKYKLKNDKNINVEEITPVKYTKSSITSPELMQPALSL